MVGFEELGASLAPESAYVGEDLAGGFESGGVFFPNTYTPAFGSWEGWAYSNTTDATTPGPANQFSAITGAGREGSRTYAVAFPELATETFRIELASRGRVAGGWFTNTTFAGLSMRDGDAFAKRFGGPTGADPDFFRLDITGLRAGVATGSVSYYLADYRFKDDALDFIVNTWEWVDLSGLGRVDALELRFASSDVGVFGINTPTYVALDDLVVPEPNVPTLVLLAGLGAVFRRSR
jgi:hypothetical protein